MNYSTASLLFNVLNILVCDSEELVFIGVFLFKNFSKSIFFGFERKCFFVRKNIFYYDLLTIEFSFINNFTFELDWFEILIAKFPSEKKQSSGLSVENFGNH